MGPGQVNSALTDLSVTPNICNRKWREGNPRREELMRDLREMVAARMSLEEKNLVQALAARRGRFVSHLIRDVLLDELREEFGEGVVPQRTEPEENVLVG